MIMNIAVVNFSAVTAISYVLGSRHLSDLPVELYNVMRTELTQAKLSNI